MNAEDSFFMEQAVRLAREALRENEVPVGAVVVRDQTVIGRGFNSVIASSDPTAHAEMTAMREAAKKTGNYRLTDADVYVTLEPCLMCFTAMIHARARKLVFGASDLKTGVFSTGAFDEIKYLFNHVIEVKSGVMSDVTSNMLSDFFRARRGARAVEWGGLENR